MNLSEKDYRRFYRLQDKFLSWLHGLGFPFYLTGGTALGRYYINHRFSEDLDFFVNRDPFYPKYIAEIKSKIVKNFDINLQQSLFSDDFTRLFIDEDEVSLKIEFVNDVEYYPGKPASFRFGLIDTPLNILSNKLTAVTGRDEPKDIFDIVYISFNYSYNWRDVFYHSKQKAVINEIDVEKRLCTFPAGLLKSVNWLKSPVDEASFNKDLKQVADDFFLGKDNSMGVKKHPIENALPRPS